MHYDQATLTDMLNEKRAKAHVICRMLRPLAGGQPADEKGLKAFVQHHLKLLPGTPEFDEAVKRIQIEEIGTKETTPENGEVETAKTYAVNVIRRSEKGPFILDHMVKAMLKQSASRLGLFATKGKVGSKGDMAELGTIVACGESLQAQDRPWEIYLRVNGGPAVTEYHKISGSVGTPKGRMSIQHHTEVALPPATFEFNLFWPAKKLTGEDMALIMAAATQIGIGSVKSLDYARFEIVDLDV